MMTASYLANITYCIFLLAILMGLIVCWQRPLAVSLKCFWSAIIILFPIAGTILFWVIQPESEEISS